MRISDWSSDVCSSDLPAVPGIKALLPYLSDHWRDMVEQRGVHELDSNSYPNNAPLTARPDWRPAEGKAGTSLDMLRTQALDGFGTSLAICNCLYGVRSEEHTSELQSLMRISYAVFCLKKKKYTLQMQSIDSVKYTYH